MSLFGKKKQDHGYIVLSIDSGSVGLAVVAEALKEKVPQRTIVFSTRQEIVIPPSITMDLYQSATTKALKEVIASVMQAKIKVPREVHVILSSPWQSSQTRFVSVTKEKRFKITHHTIGDLMKKEESQFVLEAENNPALFGNDFVLFESKTMSANLNGYPIVNPLGKSVTSMDLALHLAGASKSAMNSFSQTVREGIPHASVAFHSSVFALFAGLRDIFHEIKSFLVIEVSEMLSEVTIVENATLSQAVSFPCGLHIQADLIAQELGKNEKETAMYIRMYNEKTLEEKLRVAVESAMQKAQREWATQFGQAVSSLSKDILVPDAVFLVCNSAKAMWVQEAVKSEVLLDYKIASQSFTFLSLSPEHVSEFIKTTGSATHDIMLELSALYISTKTVRSQL